MGPTGRSGRPAHGDSRSVVGRLDGWKTGRLGSRPGWLVPAQTGPHHFILPPFQIDVIGWMDGRLEGWGHCPTGSTLSEPGPTLPSFQTSTLPTPLSRRVRYYTIFALSTPLSDFSQDPPPSRNSVLHWSVKKPLTCQVDWAVRLNKCSQRSGMGGERLLLGPDSLLRFPRGGSLLHALCRSWQAAGMSQT